jgi:DNA-binding transcriptional ArsR family regulator
MSMADLGRTRFAYSPLAEVAESLYVLSARQVPAVHQPWLAAVRPSLGRVDLALLTAVVPARPFIADFFFGGVGDRSTSIEQQLQALATTPTDVLRRGLEQVWRGDAIPEHVDELLAHEGRGPRRLADALWEYWRVALEPRWPLMRAVLDDDVAYRAGELAQCGIEGLLSGVHPDLSMAGDLIQIEKKRHSGREEHDLAGTGMLLVPSIFVWPNVLFAAGPTGPPSLTYPARGIGNVWQARPSEMDEDPLASLLGRSRAAILRALSVPQSTTDLALSLRQSPPSVSQHLSVLRRTGLVVSWRSGRRVYYRRTALADSVLEASGGTKAADAPSA